MPNALTEEPWTQRQATRLENALRYYMGPAYAPVEMAGRFVSGLLPGADMMDMAQSSGDLMGSQSWGEAGRNALGLGAATLGMAIPGTARGIEEGVEEAAQGIRAYHGSPHDFDRFDMGKIGTGEGAQAYGHGLYFAEKEGVAHDYRQKLSQIDETALAAAIPEKWLGHARSFASTADSPDLAVRDFTAWTGAADTPEVRQAFADAMKSRGHMYEVNIAANPDDFLDWDKPLSEQSEKVRGALMGEGGFIPELRANEHASEYLDSHVNDDFEGLTGNQFHSVLGRLADEGFLPTNGPRVGDLLDSGRGKEAIAPFLRNEGIPGIRYLDQGSRAAGDGSRNYVVFDDNLVSILRKYGLLAGVGLGGMATGNALTEDQGGGM